MRRAKSILLAFLFVLARAGAVRAQSVAEVVEGMYAAAERQATGVDDYTLTQLVMGAETFSYFERELYEGHPVFRLKLSDRSGFSLSLAGADYGLGDVFLYGPQLIEHARYAGTEQIGNFSVHVLGVDDASALGIVAPSGASDAEFTLKSLRLYVDTTLMVPRRVVLVGDVATAAVPAEITIQIDLQSYLPIESLWVPFKTTLQVAGGTVDITVAEVLINAGRPQA
ncbi:MAG: hypothetical protein FJ207_12155 [Gemmatimonadetes bacterium]|nr:hypothetical protein [Gemmatimonadota bacterium]